MVLAVAVTACSITNVRKRGQDKSKALLFSTM
jgi:hypothetical protein